MLKHIPLAILTMLLGYTGGATTQQWLSADGTISAPAYSFSTDTDLGLYRSGAGSLCATAGATDIDGQVCFANGQAQIASSAGGYGLLYLDTASIASWMSWDSTTDYFGWYIDSSTDDVFMGTYGTRFANAPGITTTYMHTYTASGGNLVMGNSTGTAWTTSHGLGYTSHGIKLDVGGRAQVGTTGISGLEGAGDGSIAWVNQSTIVAYTRLKDLVEAVTSACSLAIGYNTGTPTGAACDNTAEDGRLYHNYGDNRVYVCNQTSTNGWYYFDLTE